MKRPYGVFTACALALVCGWATVVELSARNVQRSGSNENPERETPLSPEVRRYRPLLDLSNRSIEALIAGDYGKIYDAYFSDILREDIERAWLLQQMGQVENLYGRPGAYGKEQWWFEEEERQGRTLVHSVKLVRHGGQLFRYVFSVYKHKPDVLRGFRWVAPATPQPRRIAALLGQGSRPVIDDAESFQRHRGLLTLAEKCLGRIKAKKDCRAHFSDELKQQIAEQVFQRQFARLSRTVGPMRTAKADQWMLVEVDFPRRRVISLRQQVRHKDGDVLYIFSVYGDGQGKLVGFQIVPVGGPSRSESHINPNDR